MMPILNGYSKFIRGDTYSPHVPSIVSSCRDIMIKKAQYIGLYWIKDGQTVDPSVDRYPYQYYYTGVNKTTPFTPVRLWGWDWSRGDWVDTTKNGWFLEAHSVPYEELLKDGVHECPY